MDKIEYYKIIIIMGLLIIFGNGSDAINKCKTINFIAKIEIQLISSLKQLFKIIRTAINEAF